MSSGKKNEKKKKHGKERQDKYYHLAKDQGFRARSAFKLIQLNKKFSFLNNARVCIDLCAAPGGWLQVARKFMPLASLIIGVDLVPIRAISGVTTFAEDITSDKCRAILKREMKTWKADVVLHDGAPNVGANWSHDAYSQCELVLHAAKLACEFLMPNGTFVSKIFRSEDYNSVLYVLQKLFRKVEVTKPTASRSVSAEIFIVCLGYKAPIKLDPKLFDPRSVFEVIEDGQNVVDLFAKRKSRAPRVGYSLDNPTLHKTCSVAKFVEDRGDPKVLLGSFNQIFFSCAENVEEHERCQSYLQNRFTTPEIVACLKDVRVLSLGDLRTVLRWRDRLRKEAEEAKLKNEPKEEVKEDAEDEDAESDIDKEIDNLAREYAAREKRSLRRQREVVKKYRDRAALQMTNAAPGYDDGNDTSLFSLALSQKADTYMDADAHVEIANQIATERESKAENRLSNRKLRALEIEDNRDGCGSDDDEDDLDYEDLMERRLELQYQQRIGAHVEDRGRDKKRHTRHMKDVHANEETAEYLPNIDVNIEQLAKDEPPEEFEDIDRPSKGACMWFNQQLFDDIKIVDDESDEDDIAEMKAQYKRKQDTAESADMDEDAYVDERDDKKDIEFVPNENTSSVWSATDLDTKCHALALATRMHTNKKERYRIIEDAYNRHTFNDGANIPNWFRDEETTFRQRRLPVTPEEMEVMKAKFKMQQTRSIKKVVEAKARRKSKAMKQLENVRSKANRIVGDTDTSVKDQMKNLQKLYANKQSNDRGPKAKHLDARMRKDFRGKDRAEAKKMGKKRPRSASAAGRGRARSSSASSGRGRGSGGERGGRGQKSQRGTGPDAKKKARR